MTVLIFIGFTGLPVNASRGLPGSQEFGIGVHLSLDDNDLQSALDLANSINPDWTAIEVSWTALVPEPHAQADWSRLDTAVETLARSEGISILLSVSHPPTWALNGLGPDGGLSADFVGELVGRYNGRVEALELFPAPNTRAGWGDLPNPAQYVDVYRAVAHRLAEIGTPILLICGGLEISLPPDDRDAISDIEYLRALYAAGAGDRMPVVALRYVSVAGQPLDPPTGDSSGVLRHYETVRREMVAAGHVSGTLWITALGFPPDMPPKTRHQWLFEAYPQVRSQLYIGTAFFYDLKACPENPEESNKCAQASLTTPGGGESPFSAYLRSMLTDNAATTPRALSGRAKSDVFHKFR